MSVLRRDFIRGIGAIFAAPAIVRASSLMPVFISNNTRILSGYNGLLTNDMIVEQFLKTFKLNVAEACGIPRHVLFGEVSPLNMDVAFRISCEMPHVKAITIPVGFPLPCDDNHFVGGVDDTELAGPTIAPKEGAGMPMLAPVSDVVSLVQRNHVGAAVNEGFGVVRVESGPIVSMDHSARFDDLPNFEALDGGHLPGGLVGLKIEDR